MCIRGFPFSWWFDLRIPFQSLGYDGEGAPALCLHVSQPFRRDVFLKERGDAGVEVGAEGAERVAVAIAEGTFWNGSMGGGRGASLCHFETGNEQAQSIKLCGGVRVS